MKAILVIDMPKNCDDECRLNIEGICCATDERIYSIRCPLKPLPKERELKSTEYLEHYRLGHTGTYEREAYSIGWNECLEEIEK